MIATDARVRVEMLRASVGTFYYPALAAPLGPDDEPVCPPLHVEALTRALDQRSYGWGLHLLIIGYSCLDKTPLELIGRSGNVIKSVVIANGNAANGEAALKRLQDYLTSAAPHEGRDYVEIVDYGFDGFARPELLRHLVDRVRAAEPAD